MSIIRTVKELGLSQDHFLITGNDNRHVYDFSGEMRINREEFEATNTLDTAEGWFRRGRMLNKSSQPIGFINDKAFFHANQTIAPSDYKKEMLDVASSILDQLVARLVSSGIKSEQDLDEKAYAIFDVLVHALKEKHIDLKNNVNFDVEKNYLSMDADIPF